MSTDRNYRVERRTIVDAPPDVVRERLVDFRRWQAWSPWEDLDPEIERTFGGTECGVGAWYEWDGNRKAGRGRMEIVEDTDERVVVDLQFLKPFKSHTTTVFELPATASGTEVVWTMIGPETRMTRVMGLFTSMDKLLGPDFEKGLARLKTDAEADARAG